jgi:peptidoglycan L-alanyl-D-glutamate endopeptidase CwlK
MINSRKIDDLHPILTKLCLDHIHACKKEGIELLITSTYRDHESQNALYAQGRTKPGNKVTNAKGGESWHNFRVAYDVVPLRNGKPVWGTKGEDLKIWQRVGEIGKSLGLEWAGDWKTFKEFPHFQYTKGYTLAQFRNGATLA